MFKCTITWNSSWIQKIRPLALLLDVIQPKLRFHSVFMFECHDQSGSPEVPVPDAATWTSGHGSDKVNQAPYHSATITRPLDINNSTIASRRTSGGLGSHVTRACACVSAIPLFMKVFKIIMFTPSLMELSHAGYKLLILVVILDFNNSHLATWKVLKLN